MSLSAPGGYVYMLAPSGASLLSASSLDASGGLMYPQLFAPSGQAPSGSLASFLTHQPGGLVLQPLGQAPHPNTEAGTSRQGRSRRARSEEEHDDDDGSDDLQQGRNAGGKGADTGMGVPRGVKEKNREAQRRFRARQKVLISGLKETMEQMQTRVAKQEQELQCLRDENAILRQLLASAQQAAAAAAIAAANGSAVAHHHSSANGSNNANNNANLSAGQSEPGLALQRLDSAVAMPGLTLPGGHTLYLQAMGGGMAAFGPSAGAGGLPPPGALILQPQQQQQQQPSAGNAAASADAPSRARPQTSGDKTATTGASA